MSSDPVNRRTARKIIIEKDTETARAAARQWLADNPTVMNFQAKIEKHCEGKQVTIDFEVPPDWPL